MKNDFTFGLGWLLQVAIVIVIVVVVVAVVVVVVVDVVAFLSSN